MASFILTGNDFVSNSSLPVVEQDGSIDISGVSGPDFGVGLVSRDVFDVSSGNKAIRFVFQAKPSVAVARRGIYGRTSSGKVVALSYTENGPLWSGTDVDASNTCSGEPDCLVLSRVQCEDYYHCDISDTHTIVKSGSCVKGFGDNTNGQIDLTSTDSIRKFACGNGFTVIIRNDGTVELLGNNSDASLTVPDELTNFSESDMPMDVVATSDSYVVLKKNGSVVAVGNIDTTPIGTDKVFISMSAGESHAGLVDISGSVTMIGDNSFGQANAINRKVLKLSCAKNRTSYIANDGKVYSIGEGLSSEQLAASVDYTKHVSDVIAGESFVIAVYDDSTFTVDGQSPSYLSDINGSKIGWKGALDLHDDKFDYFPFMRNRRFLNFAAGIQVSPLSSTTETSTTQSGGATAVIAGGTSGESVLEKFGENAHGVILTCTNGGAVYNDTRGVDGGVIGIDGHRFIDGDFITDDDTELYELIIVFSVFGRQTKFRKIMGNNAIEYNSSILNTDEHGPQSGNVCLYIRNASKFSLKYVEVTDEIDATLLPAEAVYRDINTDVLHTKAANMANDIMESIESTSELAKTTSSAIKELAADYKQNLQDIYSRIEALEGN